MVNTLFPFCRLVGRVIKFPFKSTGGYSKEIETAMQGLLALVRSNKVHVGVMLHTLA